ncbi:YhgE/Pip domain-containing protein [Bacillus massiliigorillae]|uniref:YhgE/Pip domain-containing protein n=1 Tax=Bacillus massiliigorillae TaxID=1243664 RepID=UPI0003A0CFC9|nr:YhgE/Pip domain-containing protein [Bacillus massiliigorillae]
MKGNSFLGEWKSIFTNKALLIPIIAVMLIPVMYAGMFLWAFWDPYDKLEDLPVAIVNEDNGASFEGEELHLGDELVKNLKKDKQFNFIFVDKEKGYKNLKDQDYYMLVEIPKDFSGNATTILDDTPKKLELKYVPNEGYNFLSAQIGETAIEKIKAAVSEKIIKTYSDTIFDKMQTMADGYQNASDKAGELFDGASKVSDGNKTMKESLATLAAKQIEFKSGVDTIYEGVGKLSSGSDTLASGVGQLSDKFGDIQKGGSEVKAGIDTLASKSKELNSGMNTAYSKTNELVNGAKELHSGSVEIQNGLQALNGKIPALAEGVKEVSAGAKSISDNANKLSSGAGAVAEGAKNLQNGLQQLQNSLSALPPEVQQQLSGVVSQLVTGSQQVAAGSQEVATGSKSLAAGSNQLANGGTELASGANAAQAGIDKLANGSQTLTAGLNQLSNGASALHDGLGQLSDGTGQLITGVGQLQKGQNTLVAGMQQYGSKMKEASKGALELNLGLQTLSGGVTQLADGSNQLADGTSKISAGANELADGSGKVQDGTKQFKTELGDAAKESSKLNATEKTSDMMSEPLAVDKEAVDHVPNYGTGFAPYFLSLGLFVGALMLSILYPMVEPAVIPKNGFSWFASKFGVLAIVGIIQALIASAILLVGLKIEVQSVPLFLLFSIVTSLVFIALIQFFVTCFGNPGRFMAIIILILQLTTSAGTFPLELIPTPLQFFNSFLPMTYSVQGFKAVISSGNFSFMWSNVAILAGFIVVFMLGTLSYFMLKFKKSYSKFSTEETA